MKEYQIAIIGCGMIAKSHLAAIASIPNAHVNAVCDINEKKALEYAEKAKCVYFTDARTMLESKTEIDICLICLPTFLHMQFVELCASYHKAVICEKPISMSKADAIRIKSVVDKYQIPYMTAQVVRFWTGYKEIKQMLDKGEFGDIYLSVFSRCSERQVWDNFTLFDPVKGGGAMYDMMVHDIDYMNYLFGPAKQAYCVAAKDETGCYDNVIASITYESGVKSVAETAFNMHTGFPFTMYAKVMGSKAAVELLYQAGFDINQRDGALAQLKIFRQGEVPEIIDLDQYDAYAAETSYFISCLEKGINPEIVTLEDSINVISTVQAINRSADTGEVAAVN